MTAVVQLHWAPGGGLRLNIKKLVGVLVLAACVLAGCNQESTGASAASTGPAASVSPPPTIGTATLSWQAPTTDTNGAALTDLAGYRIHYGISASDLSDTIKLTGVGIQTYVIDNLGPGTWYFAISAVASTGVESALSDVVSKTI
jgi:hypothetical protein